uniref:C-type lectin domain-containing protein n=1 Tax=Graphocephala atropunctata TaxID=36148 RepID=A0A1B6MDC1_9HEMI
MLNWHAACENCRALGMEMAIIASISEQRDFNSAINSQAPHLDQLWVGLNDLKTEGRFLWVDGSRPRFHNWAPGQPDNHRGEEHCVQVLPPLQYRWNDILCDYQLHYVCQFYE